MDNLDIEYKNLRREITILELERDLFCKSLIEAEKKAVQIRVDFEIALDTPFIELFLDGRNEHGTHVLPMSLRSIDDDQIDEDLPEMAEEIMRAAEKLGYSVGDFVWAEFQNEKEQRDGQGYLESPAYWEFVRINKKMTDMICNNKNRQDLSKKLTTKTAEVVSELQTHWRAFCDCDKTEPEGFCERMESAGLIYLDEVSEDDLDDIFASERGIEHGGYIWRLTETGQQAFNRGADHD